MISMYSDSINYLMKTGDSEENDFIQFVESNIAECLQHVGSSYYCVIQELSPLSFILTKDSDIQWKIVCTGCYLLLKISNVINQEPNTIFSISQKQNVKRLFQFIVSNGVHPSLLPGVGISKWKIKFSKKIDDLEKYRRLRAICLLLNNIYRCDELRSILSTYFFSDYLAALHQLGYAPIVKPNTSIQINNQPFIITLELWKELQSDQDDFKSILKTLINQTPQSIIIKELIVLQGVKTHPLPNFMKRALTKQLSEILLAPGGLLAVSNCFLDSPNIDTGCQWKHIDMITRLVSVKHGTISDDEYLNNITDQLAHIMRTYSQENYIMVAAACTTRLYEEHKQHKHVQRLIDSIFYPFVISQSFDNSFHISTSDIQNAVTRLDLCFAHPMLSLPPALLVSIVHCLFHLRICIGKESKLKSKLNGLICKHFSTAASVQNENEWFNTILLNKESSSIPLNKKIKFQISAENVIGKLNDCQSSGNLDQSIATLIEVMEESSFEKNMAYSLFSFLLNFLNVLEISSKCSDSKEITFKTSEEKTKFLLSITKTLEILAEKECVLSSFKNSPNLIIDFIKKYLCEYSNSKPNDKSTLMKTECLTISLVLLSTLLSDSTYDVKDLLVITPALENIQKETHDDGIKFLCTEILNLFSQPSAGSNITKSKFDEAIKNICDPLLPVRAHGLMQLTALVGEHDIETISKKEFVQCIFQENLKDSDSYIYLAAVNGLATLATFCTEDVLGILSKEYVGDPTKSFLTEETENEALKLRMKIGEILLKVTKNLGPKAMDHKVLLLNTFLSGCHDTDNIMRASSISNLAELCRVLSYKLGDIIFDILKLVNEIIQYDKSIECRRASVFVISSLINGLGKEALLFLREALLPMYRTLKKLYSDEEEDSAVKLHAQIALEELNEIMMEIMAPYLKSQSNR